MLACNELVNALRDVVTAEFKTIPHREEEIEYSFSDKFVYKMQKLIKKQKKSYWNLINTTSKRVAVVLIAVFGLLGGMLFIDPVRVAALETIEEIIFKTKNIFQTAYEEGTPLSEVDKEGNFIPVYCTDPAMEGAPYNSIRIEGDDSSVTSNGNCCTKSQSSSAQRRALSIRRINSRTLRKLCSLFLSSHVTDPCQLAF